MDSIYFLIPITVLILAIAIWVFLWAVNNDQFDDMDSPASRILFDDDEQATIDEIKKQNLKKNSDDK
jgi:cbb3-type cytochrome oxidase maturation protein